jgi:hypothetical protein
VASQGVCGFRCVIFSVEAAPSRIASKNNFFKKMISIFRDSRKAQSHLKMSFLEAAKIFRSL